MLGWCHVWVERGSEREGLKFKRQMFILISFLASQETGPGFGFNMVVTRLLNTPGRQSWSVSGVAIPRAEVELSGVECSGEAKVREGKRGGESSSSLVILSATSNYRVK